MADLEELTANIWQWGVDRRIHENSTAAAEVRKAFESTSAAAGLGGR